MKDFTQHSRIEPRLRRGGVSVMVLVVLIVTGVIVSQMTRRVLQDRREAREALQALQTQQLARAGITRAKIAFGNDAEWPGESWSLPPGQIHQTNEAAVEISVSSGLATVVARYPVNSEHPIQVTRRAVLSQ